jgi:multimeric flavodoxin WrbA
MAAKRLLVLSHSRTGSTARLTDAALTAVGAVDGVEAAARDVTAAGLDDVLAADGLLLLTPARFGAVAGLTKDLFERIYPWFDEVPDVRPGLPWTMVAKGASDPTGAVRDVERIATGLRWKQVLPPLVVTGDLTDELLAAAEELAATLAAGLAEGLW